MTSWERVVSHFSGKGLPEKFMRHVCITKEDAELITQHIRSKRPRIILEVGAFIGLSTGVIASAAYNDTKLVCVDPNLPISLHRLIGSGVPYYNDETRTLDYVSGMLQIIKPNMNVRLIPGTFSTPFASDLTKRLMQHGWNLDKIPIIGNSIGMYGPYDMVFIDGDHSSAAVESDLLLVSGFLSINGEILLHDVDDNWGQGVNPGINNFLRQVADFHFLSLGSNMGVVSRKDNL